MTWFWLLIAAWIGFILGYVLCGLMSFSDTIWREGDDD